MQIPYRKPGKFSQMPLDLVLTQNKLSELRADLENLKKFVRPKAAAEVGRLAELGDFSENVEYQLAKGKLRGINNRILKLERQCDQAVIIPENLETSIVQIGHTVTVEYDNKQKTFQILGSAETDPAQGIISHTSPVGAALLGRGVGEVVVVKLAQRDVVYKIMKIQ